MAEQTMQKECSLVFWPAQLNCSIVMPWLEMEVELTK